MEVTLAGLEETGELAMGVWLNPSQVRSFPELVPCDHNYADTETNQGRRWSHGPEYYSRF